MLEDAYRCRYVPNVPKWKYKLQNPCAVYILENCYKFQRHVIDHKLSALLCFLYLLEQGRLIMTCQTHALIKRTWSQSAAFQFIAWGSFLHAKDSHETCSSYVRRLKETRIIEAVPVPHWNVMPTQIYAHGFLDGTRFLSIWRTFKQFRVIHFLFPLHHGSQQFAVKFK